MAYSAADLFLFPTRADNLPLLKTNLDKALNVFPKFESDLNQFLAQLESGDEELEQASG